MKVDVRQWIYITWAVFFVVWLIWGITAKRTLRRQSAGSRLRQSAVLIAAFWMLFSPTLRIGLLSGQILQHSSATEYAALILNAIGLALAVWARLHLGGNWSANVTLKRDHALVETGPYSVVRHPIYSGLTLAALGLAVLNGDLRSFAAVGLMLLGWRMKFQLEEKFMTEAFGNGYLEYKQRVKAIIPFVW